MSLKGAFISVLGKDVTNIFLRSYENDLDNSILLILADIMEADIDILSLTSPIIFANIDIPVLSTWTMIGNFTSTPRNTKTCFIKMISLHTSEISMYSASVDYKVMRH